MMSMSIAAALALTMQTTTGTPQVVAPDNPETWVTEYPIVIQPLVHDYRRCLNYADRRFGGEADFEMQHRSDLPRCAKLKSKLVQKSERALMQGTWSELLEPERAGDVFDTVEYVHIARGRDFDQQLMLLYRQQQARVVNTDLGPHAQNN